MNETMLKVGDQVQKNSGYRWPGIVIAVFRTLAKQERYVVECTVPEVAGALHIYSKNQLTRTEPSTITEERDALQQALAETHNDRTALLSQIGVLREALEPFAEAWGRSERKPEHVLARELTFADYERARAALSKTVESTK